MSNKTLKNKGIILIIIAIVLFSFRYIPIISVDNPISFLLEERVPKYSIDSAYNLCNTGLTFLIQTCDFVKLFNLLLIIIPALLLLYSIYLIILSDWIKEEFKESPKEVKVIGTKKENHKNSENKIKLHIDYNTVIYYGSLILVILLLVALLIWRLSNTS